MKKEKRNSFLHFLLPGTSLTISHSARKNGLSASADCVRALRMIWGICVFSWWWWKRLESSAADGFPPSN